VDEFPTVDVVAAQPLLAQVRRLQEALEFIGQPLAATDAAALNRLNAGMPDAEATRTVQDIFDRLALVAVDISAEGLSVSAGPAKPQLLHQGWRSFLVKIVNRTGFTGALEVDSPHARQRPSSLPEELDSRWMDLSVYNGRPLSPLLSGLLLEYRIVQLYSADSSSQDGVLRFRAGSHPGSRSEKPDLIRHWTFDQGAEGWAAEEHCDIRARDGGVEVSVQNFAFFHTRGMTTSVHADGGQLELRARVKSGISSPAKVAWQMDGESTWHHVRSARSVLQVGEFREYVIPFSVAHRLTGLRFDPLRIPGNVEVDWLRLSRAVESADSWNELTLRFESEPSVVVATNVLDEAGRPCIASFVIRDDQGRIYPTPSKRLSPDFYFHPQVYRGHGESVRLPAGEYTVECRRGPESIPETMRLVVEDKPTEIVYRVRRWINPAEYGWWSGDHHIHAAGCMHYENPTQGVHAPDMARHIMGEDLKIGCNLTWGPCFDYQKQFFTGKVDEASQYPYLLRYDIEVSGFGSHTSGHLCLLRLQDQMYPGGNSSDHWPTLGLNTLKWAKAQGAVTGTAHSGVGLEVYPDQRIEGRDGPALFDWKFSRLPLPNHHIPRYDSIGANEFIVDITHDIPGPDGQPVPAIDFIATMDTDRVAEWNIWYHTLNCGFRVRASGETDFPCVSGERVGMGRVYVKLNGRLNYDAWCEAIRLGRSYVSDGSGHLIDFAAQIAGDTQRATELGVNDSELDVTAGETVRFTVKAAVRRDAPKELPIELVVNGYPVSEKWIPSDGSLHDLEFEVPIEKSSWVAVRAAHAAHTNPVFVLVGKKPVRASVSSAEWCLKGVDVCWESKQGSYAAAELKEAEIAYEHARQTYRQILKEARAAE